MDVAKAQTQFKEIFDGLDAEQKQNFMQWIFKTLCAPAASDAVSEQVQNIEGKLSAIIVDIRDSLPVNGVLQSEHIYFPTVGEHADCTPEHTVHVDAFIYDDWALDAMCDEGKIHRHYCKDCNSRNVAPLTFISHSMSKRRLQHIFLSLLPDLQGKTVIDIGSRLGTVLYGAYVYSGASAIIGIELNLEFCELQKRIVEKHGLGDRIQIVSGDVRQHADLLKQADVVVIHSVTDFFLPQAEHGSFWTFVRENVNRTGVKLVTAPSLQKSLEPIKTGIELDSWVKLAKLSETAEFEANHDPELADLWLYECV